jgi:uncharacterized protein Usg
MEVIMNDADRLTWKRKIDGWRLATAEILYRMPDHKAVLQSFIWQHLDIAPQFPELKKFLSFWERNLDGPIHSVRICRSSLLADEELRFVDGRFYIQ